MTRSSREASLEMRSEEGTNPLATLNTRFCAYPTRGIVGVVVGVMPWWEVVRDPPPTLLLPRRVVAAAVRV
jgi:flagellar motor component MotA